MHRDTAHLISYAITGAIIALVLFLRLRSMRQVRRLRLETLWVVPALYLLVVMAMLWEYPPRGLAWAWAALALLVGAGIGWRRGATMRIHVDPQTHALNQQASPAALLFIVLLIVARQGLRYEAASLGLDLFQLTAVLMAFALGMFSATRLEMFVRARRLLAEARADQTPSGISTGPITSR